MADALTDLAALEIAATTSGVRLRLRVTPGARREGVTGVHGGALRVSVRAAPERGGANRAVQALLAEILGVARGAVQIERGAASRDKSVAITGVDAALARRALAARLELSDAAGSRARTRA